MRPAFRPLLFIIIEANTPWKYMYIYMYHTHTQYCKKRMYSKNLKQALKYWGLANSNAHPSSVYLMHLPVLNPHPFLKACELCWLVVSTKTLPPYIQETMAVEV